jgi:succinate dehydrogenase / fumarate reductase cytochrome b subunit
LSETLAYFVSQAGRPLAAATYASSIHLNGGAGFAQSNSSACVPEKRTGALASIFLTPYTECAARFQRPFEISRGGEGMSASATRPETDYLLRKLHSLSGIVPVGAFLAEHFWSNSYALVSRAQYDMKSEELQTIPFRLAVEWAGIFLPMLYHGGYGIYIWLRGKSNVSSYPWVGNGLYTAQRYTGLIAFAYIAWHLYTERWLTHGMSTYADVEKLLQNPWALALMFVGVLASSFHLGVGIWNFLCKWGLAATAKAQRAAGALGAVVGLSFSVVGVLIVVSFWLNWHPFNAYVK